MADLYSDMEKPTQLSQQEFGQLVDSTWTKIGGTTIQRNDTIEVQLRMRLRKSKTGNNIAKEGRVVEP